jgi:hypothetical protein
MTHWLWQAEQNKDTQEGQQLTEQDSRLSSGKPNWGDSPGDVFCLFAWSGPVQAPRTL